MSGDARDSVRQPARPVIEMDSGILVYPPEDDGEPWRAVFTENGQRKYRQAATEAKLAAKLEKVAERLRADAANMERPGADLIAYYLNPDRLPAGQRWSRKHAHTQRRLCERFAAPVIDTVACQASRLRTRSRSSMPRPLPTKATGCTACSPRWSRRESRAGTWPARGWLWCTGRPATARCRPSG